MSAAERQWLTDKPRGTAAALRYPQLRRDMLRAYLGGRRRQTKTVREFFSQSGFFLARGGSKWSQKSWVAGTTDHILLRKIRPFLEAGWTPLPPGGGVGAGP